MTRRPRRRGRRGPAIPIPGSVDRMTIRQRQVVDSLVETGSEKAAAHVLGISPVTVQRHLANARSRVGVASTVQLVYVVARSGRLMDFDR